MMPTTNGSTTSNIHHDFAIRVLRLCNLIRPQLQYPPQ
jgi:hypothetical protein